MLNKLDEICELIRLRYEIAEEGISQGILTEEWVFKNIFGYSDEEIESLNL